MVVQMPNVRVTSVIACINQNNNLLRMRQHACVGLVEVLQVSHSPVASSADSNGRDKLQMKALYVLDAPCNSALSDTKTVLNENGNRVAKMLILTTGRVL